jgi:hypothetical protein
VKKAATNDQLACVLVLWTSISDQATKPESPDTRLHPRCRFVFGHVEAVCFPQPTKKANHAVMHQEIQWHVIKHVSAF